MKKIFVDSDVILDVVLRREPYFKDSQKILSLIEEKVYLGFSSTLIMANCYYIISSQINKKVALRAINKLRLILTILPFTDKEIVESVNSKVKDFEDGVQHFIAINNGISNIISRNIKDYKNLGCNVFTPSIFLGLDTNSY